MKRKYTRIKQHYENIKELHEAGHSYREIGEQLGYTKEQIKECMRRPRRLEQQQTIIQNRRGRKSKQDPKTWEAMEKELRYLRQENALLRNFMLITERK